ncbi:MAG: DUF1015 domain-containing protein [Acidobacteriota bacterium]|nr:DUF1015 domain-containing protein [Acidobacteriota bacterium]
MANIHPFRAFRFDPNRVALREVLTQPYDKITPTMQERYYAASPYNLIAIEKGRVSPTDSANDSVYTRAAQKFRQWIAEKILIRDSEPSIYIYSQEFLVPGSDTRRVRMGFIALVQLQDYADGVVFRHERTLSAPKADRIELLRQLRAQTGQLFLLYDDASFQIDHWLEKECRLRTPLEMTDEYRVIHRMWPVSDAAFVERVRAAMASQKIIIADGHHRYETALNVRDDFRKAAGKIDPLAASEFAMATFVNLHSAGLVILPTHRLVSNVAGFDFERFRKDLRPYFDWYAYPFENDSARPAAYDEFVRDLTRHRLGRRAIGVYPSAAQGSQAFYLFALRRDADLELLLPDETAAQRGLDVVLLHRLILEKGLGISADAVASERNVAYERELDAAISSVDAGKAQVAFLLNSVRIEQVAEIALGGEVLPQKSTDFYPKLLSGVTIYQVEGRVDAPAAEAATAQKS